MMSLNKTLSVAITFILFLGTSIAHGEMPVRLKILSVNSTLNAKTITLRINQRISLKQVENIASQLKKKEDFNYETYSVYFLLPNQKEGAGAWARAFFEPNLKADILGATLEDVQKFNKFSISNGWITPSKTNKAKPVIWSDLDKEPKTYQHGGKIIGEWISDRHGAASKLTLFSKDGEMYVNYYYPDGSQGTTRYKAKKIKTGLRLDEMDRTINASGDYYVVNKKGQLEFHDNDGLFLTLPPERIDRP